MQAYQKAAIREDLCLAYHILAYLGLDDHTYTHLSARVPEESAFYIYPFGQRFEETRPETLLRVSFDGHVLEGSEHQYNKTGYIIHSALYKKRPEVQAVFHLHTPSTVAVSSTKHGLLPISQWALHFYKQVSYHDYDALALSDSQGDHMAKDMGTYNILFLRHHGFITTGKTLAEALFYTYHLEQASKTQCLAQAMNTPLLKISSEVCEKTVSTLLAFEKDLGQRDWLAWKRKLGHPINTLSKGVS